MGFTKVGISKLKVEKVVKGDKQIIDLMNFLKKDIVTLYKGGMSKGAIAKSVNKNYAGQLKEREYIVIKTQKKKVGKPVITAKHIEKVLKEEGVKERKK